MAASPSPGRPLFSSVLGPGPTVTPLCSHSLPHASHKPACFLGLTHGGRQLGCPLLSLGTHLTVLPKTAVHPGGSRLHTRHTQAHTHTQTQRHTPARAQHTLMRTQARGQALRPAVAPRLQGLQPPAPRVGRVSAGPQMPPTPRQPGERTAANEVLECLRHGAADSPGNPHSGRASSGCAGRPVHVPYTAPPAGVEGGACCAEREEAAEPLR